VNDVSSNVDGSYELSYVVYQPGVFLLDICLNSRPVHGSPFRLRAHREVKGSVEALQRRRSDSRMKSSSTSGGGSSFGGSGTVGVKRPASSQSHGSQQRISSVDDDLLLRIGSQGRNKGQFMNPQVCCLSFVSEFNITFSTVILCRWFHCFSVVHKPFIHCSQPQATMCLLEWQYQSIKSKLLIVAVNGSRAK